MKINHMNPKRLSVEVLRVAMKRFEIGKKILNIDKLM